MDKVVQEEPEEGEIIDDFEVISDYSIPSSPVSGKSVPHKDLLRDVSLSSISDSESDVFRISASCAPSRHPHKRKRKRSQCRKRRKSQRFGSESSQSDFDSTLRKQLKRAVRIDNSSAEVNHNSLQTRLKAMLGKGVEDRQDDDQELQTLRKLALSSRVKGNTDKENEDAEQNDEKQTDEDEELFQLRLDALKSAMIKKAVERKKRKENKENDVNKDNKDIENNVEIKENEKVDKEDEIPVQNSNSNSNNNSIDEDVDIMRAMLLVSMSNKVIPKDTKNSTPIISVPKKTFPKPIYAKPVKQLIINLKDSDDSDSEDVKTSNIKDKNPKTDDIEHFLKTQRAAVEEKCKQQQSERDKNDLLLDKSVVKLLPKSQQREYQILKQKLLMARRKKLRKTSTKSVNKVNNVVPQPVKNNGQKQETRTIFQRTLEDMQVKKSGRLQMKGKYKALAPLLQRVNCASLERKRCELDIKRLLVELQKARDKLFASHQNYVGLVTKLVRAKNAVDRGASNTVTTRKNGPTVAAEIFLEGKKTSTPVKDITPQVSCDVSSIEASNSSAVAVVPDTNIEDKKEEVKKCEDIKKYVSPLDTRNSEQVNNPLTMYCPFELFGVCKDPECQFNHCSKNVNPFHAKQKNSLNRSI